MHIPGASSGIGEATALEFAREGAKVALNSRTEEKLKKTAAKCQDAGLQEKDVRILRTCVCFVIAFGLWESKWFSKENKSFIVGCFDTGTFSRIASCFLFLVLQIFIVVGDMTKQEDCIGIVDRTLKHFGRIDILVYSFCAFVDKTKKPKQGFVRF